MAKPHPKWRYAGQWGRTTFVEGYRHLKKEGVGFTIALALVAGVVAWARASGVPQDWFYTRAPWRWFTGTPDAVNVGELLGLPLVCIAITAGLYLLYSFLAAPYRMAQGGPSPTRGGGGGGSVNFHGPVQQVVVTTEAIQAGFGAGGGVGHAVRERDVSVSVVLQEPSETPTP